jgi:hypothetical protein
MPPAQPPSFCLELGDDQCFGLAFRGFHGTNGRFVADGVLDASSTFGNPIALFQRSAVSGALISGFFERLAHADGHGDHGNRGGH